MRRFAPNRSLMQFGFFSEACDRRIGGSTSLGDSCVIPDFLDDVDVLPRPRLETFRHRCDLADFVGRACKFGQEGCIAIFNLYSFRPLPRATVCGYGPW
jgi:hypothetical protein